MSNTSVVHHRDLPGPLTGGEQPHLRRFPAPVPWQVLCSYSRMNTVWGALPLSEAILALDQVQPDVHLLGSQISLFSDEDHQDRCPSVQLQLRGHWWAQHVNGEPATLPNQHQTKPKKTTFVMAFSKVSRVKVFNTMESRFLKFGRVENSSQK